MAKAEPRNLFPTLLPLAHGAKLLAKQRREFMLLAKQADARKGSDWEPAASQAKYVEEGELPGPPQLLPPAVLQELGQFLLPWPSWRGCSARSLSARFH